MGVVCMFFEDKMNKYIFTDNYSEGDGCVIVLGCFDGLHKAHQKIIAEGFDVAEAKRLPLVVWALNIKRDNKLMSAEEKVSMLERLGVDGAIVEELDDIRSMDCESFVKILADKYCARHLVCGYNFTFGEGKSGDAQILSRLAAPYGISVTVVDKFTVEGLGVSSTAIRNALTSGNPVLAGTMLGRFYEINGVVEHGYERGREIGFPTANIFIKEGMIVPRFGVYRSFTDVEGKRYLSITNIGVCPSVKIGGEMVTVETHIIDQELDLYGKNISVKLASFIRPEKKFESIEMLTRAIQEDIKCIKREYESK